jgi:hypothetical protein
MSSVQIYSNTPNEEGDVNYNNKFTMTLPEEIDGENKTRFIQALNVTYPLMIDNVEEKSCGIRLRYKIHWYLATGPAPPHQPAITAYHGWDNYITFETIWLFIAPGYYTLKKLIKELNRLVREYEIHFSILAGGRVGVTLGLSPKYVRRYKTEDIVSIDYIVRTHNDFSFELTKDLKYMLGLDGYILHPEIVSHLTALEAVGTSNESLLTQIKVMLITIIYHRHHNKVINRLWSFFYGKYAPDMTNGKTRMFIYCDEVVPTTVGNVRAPLLAQLEIEPNRGPGGGLFTHVLADITHELINTKIKNLHIRVCDLENKLIHFNGGSVGIECIIE